MHYYIYILLYNIIYIYVYIYLYYIIDIHIYIIYYYIYTITYIYTYTIILFEDTMFKAKILLSLLCNGKVKNVGRGWFFIESQKLGWWCNKLTWVLNFAKSEFTVLYQWVSVFFLRILILMT